VKVVNQGLNWRGGFGPRFKLEWRLLTKIKTGVEVVNQSLNWSGGCKPRFKLEWRLLNKV